MGQQQEPGHTRGVRRVMVVAGREATYPGPGAKAHHRAASAACPTPQTAQVALRRFAILLIPHPPAWYVASRCRWAPASGVASPSVAVTKLVPKNDFIIITSQEIVFGNPNVTAVGGDAFHVFSLEVQVSTSNRIRERDWFVLSFTSEFHLC